MSFVLHPSASRCPRIRSVFLAPSKRIALIPSARTVPPSASVYPQGSQDKRVRYRPFFEEQAEALIQKAIELAHGGHTAALKLCLERIGPPVPKVDAVRLPELVGLSPAERAKGIVDTMLEGTITPSEAIALLGSIQSQLNVLIDAELKDRVNAIEQRFKEMERQPCTPAIPLRR